MCVNKIWCSICQAYQQFVPHTHTHTHKLTYLHTYLHTYHHRPSITLILPLPFSLSLLSLSLKKLVTCGVIRSFNFVSSGGLIVCWYKKAHQPFAASTMLAHLVAICWPILWLYVGPSCGYMLAYVGVCWPILRATWAYLVAMLAYVCLMLAHVEPKDPKNGSSKKTL